MNIMTKMADITRSKGDPTVQKKGPSSLGAADHLAKYLGWFSIGLGFYQLTRSHQLAETLGMAGRESLIRAYGAREIGGGVLSLSINPDVGIASRLVGDVLDIATLATAIRPDNPQRSNAGTALAIVLALTALDLVALGGLKKRHARTGVPRDYSDRSGFPQGLDRARAAAGEVQMSPDDGQRDPPPSRIGADPHHAFAASAD